MTVTITFEGASEELEMNLSNSNFFALVNALGLSVAHGYGTERADVMFNLCKSLNTKSLVQESHRDGNYYDCGRSLEQVTRYKWRLMKLASQAMQSGKDINWY